MNLRKKEYFARLNYKGENKTNENKTVFLVDSNGSIIPEGEEAGDSGAYQ